MFDNKTAEAALDLTAKRNAALDKVVGGDAGQDAASTFATDRPVVRDGHKAPHIIEQLMLVLVVAMMLNAAVLVITL